MKLFKMLGLAAMAALMAMAFLGAGSAMASSTSLCTEDESPCEEPVTHVHESTLAGAPAKLLSSVLNVECDVLFLGDSFVSWIEIEGVRFGKAVKLASPLPMVGNFTYSNCSNNCTATEENGPAELKVLKEFKEAAKVTGEGLVHLVCSGFINCRYNGVGLAGVSLGPLFSFETNGSTTIAEQTVNKESGTFCPSTAYLDITTTPLEETFISS